MNNIFVTMAAGWIVGCGAPASSSPSNAAPTPTSAEPVAEAPSAGTDPTAIPEAAPPASAPVGKSPLHVVARNVGEGDVGWLGGTIVLAGKAYVAIVDEHGDVTQSDVETPIKYYVLDGVHGRWPDSLWSYSVDFGGRTGGNRLSVAGKTDWTLARLQSNMGSYGITLAKGDPKVRDGGSYFGLASWKGGAMLAAYSDDYGGPLALEAFDRSAKPIATPKLSRGTSAKCKERLRAVNSPMSLGRHPVSSALAAQGTGEVYVVGKDCDTGRLAVESFDRAGVGSLTTLPAGDEPIETAAVYAFHHGAVAVTAVSKSGVPALFVWDGGTWQENSLPTEATILSMTITAEGTTWLVDHSHGDLTGRLFRQPRGGAWGEVSLPPPASPSPEAKPRGALGVWGDRDEDVWVLVTGATDKTVDVLRTRPASKVFEGPEGDYDTRLANSPPSPATPDCTTFVLLYTLQKTTPANYDFPLTQDALKGHKKFSRFKFAVTEAGGRRFFGAFAPDQGEMGDESPWRDGKELVALIKKKVPSATPLLLCHRPKMVREVKIQF